MSVVAAATPRSGIHWRRLARRHAWTVGVYVLLRDTLELLTSFGDGGRQAGQFYGVHSVAVDSKGNLYTTETWEGKRLQKFVFKGVERVTTTHQGVVWPRSPQ